MVAPGLLRTSKILAGLAAGNWVLSRDWLTESVKAGHCINPVSAMHVGWVLIRNLATLIGLLSVQAPYELNTIDGFAVAKFWREFRQKHQLRAFEGLEVCFHMHRHTSRHVRMPL